MQRQTYTVEVDAPRERVWAIMLEPATFREWTAAFAPGSRYEGEWREGSTMRFLAPDPSGDGSGPDGGMVSRVRAVRAPEHVSVEHVGTVVDGEDRLGADDSEGWAGALESYTLRELAGGDSTEVLVEIDVEDSYAETFGEMWPKALERLKALAEDRPVPAATVR